MKVKQKTLEETENPNPKEAYINIWLHECNLIQLYQDSVTDIPVQLTVTHHYALSILI